VAIGLGLIAQYRKAQDFVCLTTIPVFTAIIFASPPLLAYLLNPTAAAELTVPMMLLAIGFYMNGTLAIPFMLSVAMGRPGIASRTNLWVLVLSLPVTVTLIFGFGLVGAGLAWIAYHVLCCPSWWAGRWRRPRSPLSATSWRVRTSRVP
jgi:O-antigen/teichoic acid export membrane protein